MRYPMTKKGHWTRDIPNPCEQTDACENVTLTQLFWQAITSNDRQFGCPIIYTDTIEYAILFINTSTMLDTIKFIR